MTPQKINLDMIPGKETPVIHISQKDIGAGRLQFAMKMDGADYTPSGSVKIQGTKPGGGTFEHSATRSGQTVTANVTADMTDQSGNVRAQLVFTEGENVTGTQVFILRVQRAAYDYTAV